MYLLPCTCGEKIEVDRSQAGLSLRCRCGNELAVPTLRGFAQLEQTTPDLIAPQRAWGMRQGLLFLGTVIVVAAAVAAAGLWHYAPVYPQQAIDSVIAASSSTADIEQATPVQLLELWNKLKKEPDFTASHDFERLNNYIANAYTPATTVYWQRTAVAIAAAIIGAAILAAGLFLPRSFGESRPEGRR